MGGAPGGRWGQAEPLEAGTFPGEAASYPEWSQLPVLTPCLFPTPEGSDPGV